MTIVDERPNTAPTDTWPEPLARSWAPTSSWRLSARLARREVRRRPGRTFLVALLVAVPIMAMTIGSILVRSNTDEAAFERSYGTGDFAVTQYGYFDEFGQLHEPVDLGAVGAGLTPDGTTSTEILTVYTNVTAPDIPSVFVAATRFDPESPITVGIFEVLEGRLPTAPDDVLLEPSVADDFGVEVGDELRLERPDRTVTVVGLGRAADDHNRPVMLFGGLDQSEVRGATVTTVVDLPPDVDARGFLDSVVESGNTRTAELSSASVQLREGNWYSYNNELASQQTQALAWGWVIGVLVLAAVGIIIAAAFATSARRQLTTVGQLAANGASPRLIRRTLSLQGTWSGIVGALVGIGLGVVLFVLGTPIIERLARRSWTYTMIAPVDLVILLVTGAAAATVAALLPSRSLANTSVLQALAGRRPIRAVKGRTVALGLASFCVGTFLLLVAASVDTMQDSGDANLFALVAVLGGVGVLAGMCLASPVAVTASTWVAARMGAAWKLSGRSLARTRWRSAAVVTAIGVAGAFAIAAATVAAGVDGDPYEGPSQMPLDQATIRTQSNGEVADVSTLDQEALDETRAVMAPASESMMYGIDLAPPENEEAELAYNDGLNDPYHPNVTPYEVTIVDDELLDGMGMSSADRATLDEVGAMSPWTWSGIDAVDMPEPPPIETVTLLGLDTAIDVAVAPMKDSIESLSGVTTLLMTEDAAVGYGLDVIPVGIRFTGEHDLTADQRRDLDEIRFGTPGGDSWIVGDEPADWSETGNQMFWIEYQYVNYTPSEALIQLGIVAATLLLVLLVVAIGLSLAAAESRDERNTLIAVGASPRTLRRRSATTATLLAVTGGVIAVPTGLIPTAVVLRTTDNPVTIPWLSILGVVVAVPLLVGAIALVGSSITQRIRPPKVMQDRTD